MPGERLAHGEAIGNNGGTVARPSLRRVEVVVALVSQPHGRAIQIERLDNLVQGVRDRLVKSLGREVDEPGRDLADE